MRLLGAPLLERQGAPSASVSTRSCAGRVPPPRGRAVRIAAAASPPVRRRGSRRPPSRVSPRPAHRRSSSCPRGPLWPALPRLASRRPGSGTPVRPRMRTWPLRSPLRVTRCRPSTRCRSLASQMAPPPPAPSRLGRFPIRRRHRPWWNRMRPRRFCRPDRRRPPPRPRRRLRPYRTPSGRLRTPMTIPPRRANARPGPRRSPPRRRRARRRARRRVRLRSRRRPRCPSRARARSRPPSHSPSPSPSRAPVPSRPPSPSLDRARVPSRPPSSSPSPTPAPGRHPSRSPATSSRRLPGNRINRPSRPPADPGTAVDPATTAAGAVDPTTAIAGPAGAAAADPSRPAGGSSRSRRFCRPQALDRRSLRQASSARLECVRRDRPAARLASVASLRHH
jgi:hypothetical protein